MIGNHSRNLSVSTEVAPPPPLVVASLTLRTALSPKTNHNEIILASVVLHNQFSVDKQISGRQLFQEHFCGNCSLSTSCNKTCPNKIFFKYLVIVWLCLYFDKLTLMFINGV